MSDVCPHCLFEHHIMYLKPYSGDDRRFLQVYDFLKVPHFCPNCGKMIEKKCECCGQVIIGADD